MIDVLQIVASIEAEKESKNVFPTHALLPEIMVKVKSEVMDDLNRLVSEGKLAWCETLNTYGFSTIKNK
jgi:hypothetical protein